MSNRIADRADPPGIRRLNWGCGAVGVAGWINSDLKEGRSIQLTGDIRDGLLLETNTIDYAVSIHALPEINFSDQLSVLHELRRVIKPGGVLRLGLPDIDRAIDAYRRGDRSYYLIPDEDATSLGGKFILQLIWYGYSKTFFTKDFIEELLYKAGFKRVEHVGYQQTSSEFYGITELDNREAESLFVEGYK